MQFDATLLECAKKGDREAQSDLLGKYRNYLRLLARLQIDRQLQAKADPSDLVQETLLLALRDFEAFRGINEAELAGWLRTIMARTSAQLVRRYKDTKSRDVALERQLSADLDHSTHDLRQLLVTSEPSPSQHVVKCETAVLLADALSRLPEDYREAIVLCHLQGKRLAEVATRMDRSVDAVKKVLARAMIRLRSEMKSK